MRQTAINAIYDLAKRDSRVVFIGSDLGSGTLEKMKQEMPDRFFMEGVSEQHIVGMAAGMAMEGYIPYINTIATFLTRRCYEQIAIDLCLHDLPVRLLGSGGGLVYAPLGPTHLAIEDISLMRSLPNMTVVAPVDADEMRLLMDSTLQWEHPIYIRMAKGGDPIVSKGASFEFGKAVLMREAGDIMFISTGIMTASALKAASALSGGVSGGVLHCPTIKPLDGDAILSVCKNARLVVTLEEHVLSGGIGSAVCELLADRGVTVPLLRLGLPDRFAHGFGSQDHLLSLARLDVNSILSRVEERLTTNTMGIS